MEKQLERIEAKLDQLALQTVSMSKDVAENTKDVAEHIRRTNLLEQKLHRIYTALYVLAGVGLAAGFPQIKALIKVFL